MQQRIAKTDQFHFRDGEKWSPLPHWAHFFISLGASLWSVRSPTHRVVAALSVPTPSYAAAFVSLGRVLSEPIVEPERSALDNHFETLLALPAQTPLIYFNGEALYHGPFLGAYTHDHSTMIRMGIRGGSCMVPKERCLLVEIQPESEKGRSTSAGGRLRNPKPFVSHFFELVEHYRVLCSTSKAVVIIGEQNRLRNEIVESPLAVINGEGYIEGTLQDLVRIGKFANGAIGCRAEVHARSRDHAVQLDGRPERSPLVVLDGASAYLRWAHQFPSADILGILAATDSEYDLALDAANSQYLARDCECSLPNLKSSVPGIELMAHTEVRR